MSDATDQTGEATTADLAGEPIDRIVCFCHCIMLSQLVQAIRSGAITLAQIKDRTRASTGCGGCESDVLELLRRLDASK